MAASVNQDHAVLEMRGISKRFPGVQALSEVDLRVRPGEIHALVGENGAGKSTLVKVLSGAIQKDAGAILVDGAAVSIQSPRDARALGIGIVYQEFSLVPALTVAENILLGRFPSHAGFLDRGAMHQEGRAYLDELGVEIDTSARSSTLSVAQQQLVEIAKVLAMRPRLLVLDEPSAVLGGADLDRLFAVLTRLRERGISIVYISHRLDEVFRLADTVTVMRDGAVVDALPVSRLDHAGLVHAMSNTVGGLFGTAHGVTNAVILPHVMAFNVTADPVRFARVAEAMGEPVDGIAVRAAADRAIGAVRVLAADVGIPATLGDLGVDPEAIPEMAKVAMASIDAPTNPRHFTEQDIVTLYRRSFGLPD